MTKKSYLVEVRQLVRVELSSDDDRGTAPWVLDEVCKRLRLPLLGGAGVFVRAGQRGTPQHVTVAYSVVPDERLPELRVAGRLFSRPPRPGRKQP